MAEPTLQQVFGVNATQDSNLITISKTDLVDIGLAPDTANTAESLVAAVLLKAQTYLNEVNQEADPDIQITIEREGDILTTRNDQNYRQYTFTVNLQKLEADSTINPDSF